MSPYADLTMNYKDLVNEMSVTTLTELFIRCPINFALQEVFANDPYKIVAFGNIIKLKKLFALVLAQT